MTYEEYQAHVKKFLGEMQYVTAVKNRDYSAGTDDAMNSWYSIAERTNITPIQVWYVLLSKHVQAIERYVKIGQLSSESIHSRLIDLANYAMLGDALVKDLEQKAYLASKNDEASKTDLTSEQEKLSPSK